MERYAIQLEQSDGLLLRKANRIKTIHSSLALEGNQLSEDEVRDILHGKTIVAPIREIQEVKCIEKIIQPRASKPAFPLQQAGVAPAMRGALVFAILPCGL